MSLPVIDSGKTTVKRRMIVGVGLDRPNAVAAMAGGIALFMVTLVLLIASAMPSRNVANAPDDVPAKGLGTDLANSMPTVASHQIPFASAPEASATVSDLPDVVAMVERAVVRIDVEHESGRPGGIGSGFVIDAKGIVATNYHVVEGGARATATFSDGTRLRVAGYLAVAPEKDLVVLQLDSFRARTNPLMLAGALPRKGERVFAIGSPRGLNDTVTDGIVSAIRKPGNIDDLHVLSVKATHIQTTTAISPGNSGGPLFNNRGEVVGVNTWKHIETGMDGLNFAVSAGDLAEVWAGSTGRVRQLDSLPALATVGGRPDFRDVTSSGEAALALRRVRRFTIFPQATLSAGAELPQLQDVIESSLADALRSRGHRVMDGSNSDSLAVIVVLVTLEQRVDAKLRIRSQVVVMVPGQSHEVLIIWRDDDVLNLQPSRSRPAQDIVKAIDSQMDGHAHRLALALKR